MFGKLTYIIGLVWIFSTVLASNCQAFQFFETGMAILEPLVYSEDNSYRQFAIQSRNATLVSKGQLIFSFISFSYFANQAYCSYNGKNDTAFVVSCSPNIHKISYMILQKSPSIFTQYHQQTFYERDGSFSYEINISSWKNQLKIPLKSLIKKSLRTGSDQVSNQFEFKVQNFISGLKTFSYLDVQTGRYSATRNGVGTVKLLPVYKDCVLDQQSKLNLPVSINITRSLNIKTVSFFTLILIREMPYLNFQFETFRLSQEQGSTNLSYFAGINEFQFILIGNTSQSYQNLKLSFAYNVSLRFQTTYQNIQRFWREKVFNYTKSSNLGIKLTRLSRFFYKRCYGSQLSNYEPFPIPSQGKYYKIMTGMDVNYVVDISRNTTRKNTVVLYQRQDVFTQKFYFEYLGSYRYRILNAQSNMPIRALKQGLIRTTPIQNQGEDVWTLSIFNKNNTKYLVFRSIYFRIMDVSQVIKKNQQQIITWPSPINGPNYHQLWTLAEVSLTTKITSPIGQSIASGSLTIAAPAYTKRYFFNLTAFSANSVFHIPYGYYSMQNDICYITPCINQTNKFQQTEMPYNFKLKDSQNDSYLYGPTQNANLAANTNQSYYGVCIKNATLLEFYAQMNNNLANYQNSQSITNSTANQQYFGCKSLKSITPNSSQTLIQCEECIQGYILHESLSQKMNYPASKQCYCSFGYFMDDLGICHSCDFHENKCQLKTKIEGLIAVPSVKHENQTITQYQSFNFTISVVGNYFKYLSKSQNLPDHLAIYINGLKYYAHKYQISLQPERQVSLKISLTVQSVLKSQEYRIYAHLEAKNLQQAYKSYILVNQIAADKRQNDSIKSTANSDRLNQIATNYSHKYESNFIYFAKFQTAEILIKRPFQFKRIAQNIQPVVFGLNKSSSVMLLAAPFLMDRINIFSFLQTNALLYMISFLKLEKDQSQQNQIENVARNTFIFRPEPLFRLFSLQKKDSDQNQRGYVQISRYQTQFSQGALYNATFRPLNYPINLYRYGIASFNNIAGQNTQNTLTLSLNSLINIFIQIFMIEILIIFVKFLFSHTKKQQGKNSQEKQVMIENTMLRHRFVTFNEENKSQKGTVKQKYIRWLPMPETLYVPQMISNKQQSKVAVQNSLQQNKANLQTQKSQPIKQSLRNQILYSTQSLKQKRFTFYASFIIVQLISQSYLLYFELIKPFSFNQNDLISQILNYIDLFFGFVIMFAILVFPILLINYEPLYVLKIIQITSKFGSISSKEQNVNHNIQSENKRQDVNKQILDKSYTSGQIFFHFCIIYYENLFIPFSIAIGPSIVFQAFPIFAFQVFKLIWMYKKLKILDKVKVTILCLLFFLLSCWDFIQKGNMLGQILQITIISSIYTVLAIELAKLLKFIIVLIFNTLKTKIQTKKENKQPKQQNPPKEKMKRQTSQQKQIQIIDIEEQNTTNVFKYSNSELQIGSEKTMLDKKVQKLTKIQQKSQMLKQLTSLRENLKQDLVQMRNQRRKSRYRPNVLAVNKIQHPNNQQTGDISPFVFDNENKKQVPQVGKIN